MTTEKMESMPDIHACATPSLVVNLPGLQRNIERMNQRARALGVMLRPHLKTAKCIDVARLLQSDISTGITVSTLKEAEYFLAHGISDILYAVSIAPAKLSRVAKLNSAGARIQIILDMPETAQRVVHAARDHGTRFDVLIEIDVDGHRAGIEPDDPDLLEIARILHEAEETRLLGVMTHAGEAYACSNTAELAVHAEIERSRCVAAAQRLRKIDIPCPIVSVGSTPTALCADNLNGVTELRAGVYVFFDLFQAGLGVCDTGDISLSVLTSVISHKHSHQRLIVDAGGLALSKDHSTSLQHDDPGYGLVASAVDGLLIPGLQVASVDQEHGIIQLDHPADFARFPVGSQLRILPNHACMTAAAHDQYLVVDDSGAIQEIWTRCNGW
jgi:D-serine deaminase-like pyridoxal phosphate-dependent protein